ncbi:response regulator [Myxosarcina sp. GI1]|uniref:response regulator n=1 Tax=Myxosarcina sp. GI1 TaxID=1541065 RepID=UPI00055CE102|nr:response regulator [Myxosarcina sp. GI1]
MNRDPIAPEFKSLPFTPDILERLSKQQSESSASGCLELIFGSVRFFVYLNRGKLLYATNSIDPFERLERHLRRLSHQNDGLDSKVVKQLCQQYQNETDLQSDFPLDYQSILKLSQQQYLNSLETATLIGRITREVFEAILCLPDSCYCRLLAPNKQLPEFCKFDLALHLQQCHKRLQAWKTFTAELTSTYQRLYLVTEKNKSVTNLPTEQNETICKFLKGYNFRQIGALLDRDELIVAKILYPSIVNKTIVLRDPQSPFDLLPPLPTQNIFAPSEDSIEFGAPVEYSPIDRSSYRLRSSSSQETLISIEKTWKIVCIDDSKAIQEDIQKILDNKLFKVLGIEDSAIAVDWLNKYQPDLILLDANMSNTNGYELCSLLRNERNFKTTPIIILAQERSSLDSTKLKSVGATDCLSKPFDRTQLFNIIFKYI